MSDAVTRTCLVALGRGRGGFARDRRFAGAGAMPDPVVEPNGPEPDPVADAYAQGYAEGVEAARGLAQADAAAADAARHRIETALGAMDQAAIDQLAQRLRETVLGLCENLLGDVAIDPDKLARRIDCAARMFARADDERVIRLHPEDLALVQSRLPESWHCEPDAMLERGAIRVESATGGAEDGPPQWRAALDEALRAC